MAVFQKFGLGLCYAEFAGRVPKAGSAYIYSYVTVGEFTAFVIGWNLLSEHLIAVAAVAKAMSNYVDTLLGNPYKIFMLEFMPINISFLSEYPDFISFFIIFITTMLVAWGVRESSLVNNIFTIVNLLTICLVIVSGFFNANYSNWSISKTQIPIGVKGGEGGFLPFGWAGVAAGAAKCFAAFIGFDCIATTGEETRNPKKDIPIAIVTTLVIITLAYCGVATVLTLMWPYYDQDPDAPLPTLYNNLDLPVLKCVVLGGAIFALCASLLGSLFPLPRILYSMSSDGLLYSILSKVNSTTKTPVISTLLCGLFSGSVAAIFNLEQLIDMVSIGTFQAYTIVCICILILRYQDNCLPCEMTEEKKNLKSSNMWVVFSKQKLPNSSTQYLSRILIMTFSFASIVFGISLASLEVINFSERVLFIILFYCALGIIIMSILLMSRLPQAKENLPFKVPLVPLVPCLSILFNVYLMILLDYKTWIRFSVWLTCGLLIYFFYGMKNSLEGKKTIAEKNRNELVSNY
ncbi:cationic amino acid transporter 2-like isoform X2 [Daktulosphaira vitifoliae]|uniref:cationic amino acid transporter 2-like isoform X2 n=1 Tax=Daktulosphaira vitifoliae TaxID=58002 RepID=UPI0021AA975B|nr:cationic amino acid transporter 2-like isoform X2 [Daktulosphaira vitifoliae]